LMETQESGEDGIEEPQLGALYNAAIMGRIATGPNAGRRVKTLGQTTAAMDSGEDESFQSGTVRSALVSGFSVHAGVGIRAEDRKGLERLCKYASRPPVAAERLEQLADGRLSYRLKTPWRNGTTHVLFEPEELLEKLAVLIPAPRLNLTRFHGVLAPAAKWRASIVPAPPVETPPICGCGESVGAKKRRPNYEWAALMARVFEVDVLECGHCKGRLRILAAIHPPENTRKILECLGLPTRAPPLRPAAAQSTTNDID
jgi:Putative transposase